VPSQNVDDTVDYDIQGIVGIRLNNARPDAIRAITCQIGPPSGRFSRAPDIEISFVDTIPTPNLRFLGVNDAGFDDNGFYLLKSSKSPCKVHVPFEDIGERMLCLTSEHEFKSVPLLIALINLTFLSKGYLPLHSSAFAINDSCSLVTGWAKGGKTEAMLAFAELGAAYISDEWTLLDHRNDVAFGIAEPIRLWDWQLRQVPRLRKQVSLGKRITFAGIQMLDATNRFLSNGLTKRLPPVKLLNEALPALKRQLNVRMHPKDIFGSRIQASGSISRVFLIMSHDSPEVTVEEISTEEVANRMISSNEFELLPFFEKYHAFRFAFPGVTNSFIDNIGHEQKGLLHKALDGKKAFRVLHPYPVDLTSLGKAMRPYAMPVTPTAESSL
jgi:hypothetical protein